MKRAIERSLAVLGWFWLAISILTVIADWTDAYAQPRLWWLLLTCALAAVIVPLFALRWLAGFLAAVVLFCLLPGGPASADDGLAKKIGFPKNFDPVAQVPKADRLPGDEVRPKVRGVQRAAKCAKTHTK